MRNLIIILVLATVLRFFQLGVNPPSLDWDEASIGYNAYATLKTGADEYGNKLPLAFRSFDDYKPPVYFYLAVPSIAVFGLSEWSIRLPAAMTGIGLVIAVYFLLLQIHIFKEPKKNGLLALLGAFFIAISPWSLQFSRAAFEANTGIFFFILGVALFLKSLRKPLYYIPSSLALVISLYSYHSFRVLVPVFLLTAVLLWWRDLWKNKLLVLLAGLILFVSVIPIFATVGARPLMVTVFNDDQYVKKSIAEIKQDNSVLGNIIHNRRFEFTSAIAKNYLDHFNFDFLFLTGDSGVQHHAVDMGMFYLLDFIFIIAGILYLISHRSKTGIFLLLMFIFAPIPSALTTGTPHPVRAIGMMPFFHIFAAIGFIALLNKSILKIGVSILFAVNVFYYFHQYYVHTPIEYGYFWQYGYKELFSYLKPLEPNYNKIIVTYRYDQPYIYYLLYNRTDPKTYGQQWINNRPYYERMWRQIGKYEFRNVDFGKDNVLKKTLIVGTPAEIPANDSRIIKEIKYLDGSVAFRIVSL